MLERVDTVSCLEGVYQPVFGRVSIDLVWEGRHCPVFRRMGINLFVRVDNDLFF